MLKAVTVLISHSSKVTLAPLGGAPYPIHDWWWKLSVEAVVTAEEDGFRPDHERDYLGLLYNKC